MEKINEIETQISNLVEARNVLLERLKSVSSYDRKLIVEKIEKITVQIFDLEEELLFIKGPIYNNDFVDIYLDENNSNEDEKNYNISPHNIKKIIGHVRLTFNNATSYLGNIGYSLDKEYQGNGYMIQSLELLKSPLIERNIINPILTTFPDNLASIKTIERFGGKLIEEANNSHYYNIYQADLSNTTETKKR